MGYKKWNFSYVTPDFLQNPKDRSISRNYLQKKREGGFWFGVGVAPTFPTKPTLRHKMEKYLIIHPF